MIPDSVYPWIFSILSVLLVSNFIRTQVSSTYKQREQLKETVDELNESLRDKQHEELTQQLSQAHLKIKELEMQIESIHSLNFVTPKPSPIGQLKQTSNISLDLTNRREVANFETANDRKLSKEVRIWMDGAFDMMHYGHMNAFRQGRALGTTLIVGVNSDETITLCKGKPVFNDEERLQTVRACKWVDEVVEGVPYIMNEDYINYVIEKYRIDYVVHGDDPCLVDGKDVYETAKKLGKYMSVPRTEGISTTDIVGRMLLMSRSHHDLGYSDTYTYSQSNSSRSDSRGLLNLRASSENREIKEEVNISPAAIPTLSSGNTTHVHSLFHPFNRKTNFLTTSNVIRLFAADVKTPSPGARIVYMPGSWDMFHAGHVAVLEEARKYGEYVIVGVHGDAVVNELRGHHFPIMNLHERVLSLLGCKWVDDVLIDAPYIVTRDMIASMGVSAVVVGAPNTSSTATAGPPSTSINATTSSSSVSQSSYENGANGECSSSKHELGYVASGLLASDPYYVPREMGILRTIERKNTMSVFDILNKIEEQKESLSKKFDRKMAQERDYYAQNDFTVSLYSLKFCSSDMFCEPNNRHDMVAIPKVV